MPKIGQLHGTETWERVHRLDTYLRAHATATEALHNWCVKYNIGHGPVWADLQISQVPAHGTGYRHVRLCRGSTVLSEAVVRFRAQLLSSDMLAALRETNQPFGAVIRPLQPRRRTTLTLVRQHGVIALVHHALVLTGDGKPLARTHEAYRSALTDN